MPPEVLAGYYHRFLASIQAGYDQYSFVLLYLLLVLAIGVIATIVLRLLLFVRNARQPTTILVLTPPRETEISTETTTQFFKLLHGVARYRSWIDRILLKLPTYSFEIVSQKETGIRYILRVPESQAETITKTLRGYLPGLKVNQGDDYLGTTKSRFVEFGLREHFAKPLRISGDLSVHDPIAYLTNNMTQLAAGETVALQFVVRPLSRFFDSGEYGQVNKLKSLFYQNRFNHPDRVLESSIVGNGVFGFLKVIEFATRIIAIPLVAVADVLTDSNSVTAPDPIAERPKEDPASATEQELSAQIRSKLEQPLFASSVRAYLGVRKDQRQSREQGLIGAFASLTNEHQAIVPRISLWKGWRFQTRQLGVKNILSPSELASLFHFSHSATSKTEDLVRVKSGDLPAPLTFKQSGHQLDNVFATNSYGGINTPIGQTLNERRRHTYILGATGSGKTTLLSTMIHQDIANGKGVAVIDPHGQLVEQLLRTIPEHRRQDVVWFAPDDDGFPIALNLLDLPTKDENLTPSQLQKQKSLVASSINSIFKKFYDAKYFGPRMENLLRNAVLTALETPSPTLLTIQHLLTKKDFRSQVINGMTNDVLKDFWIDEFEKLGSLQRNQMISPVTNKIGGLLSSPLNYNILTQPHSKLDFEAVMNDGKILLCDLSKGKIGEDESSFFGSLIIAKLQLAALHRALIPESERRDFFLYVDEFQNFATDTFKELVSEARKYRLSTILAHQSISQIENRDIIRVILANVGTTISFRTANPEDESFILPILSPQVSRHEITNLPLYHCYMKIAVGEPQDAFVAKVNNFTVEGSDASALEVMEHSRAQFASPVESLKATYQPSKLHTNYVASSGSIDEKLFPLSLTGTEYGGDWQTNKSRITTKHPTITRKHFDILTLLYRFRFLNRLQLQHFLTLKDPTNLNAWLLLLTKDHYLDRNTTVKTSGKQPAIYALAPNGIQVLKAVSEIDPAVLRKLYKEHERSASFIQRCLLLADINLDLRERSSKTNQFGMYLPSDYPALKLSHALHKFTPHAVIVRHHAEQSELSFIEVVSDLPEKHLRTRLTELIQTGDSGEWRDETHIPFPALKIVASTPEVLTMTQRLIKQITRKLEVSQLEILITTSDQVTKHSMTGDIWAEISNSGKVE